MPTLPAGCQASIVIHVTFVTRVTPVTCLTWVTSVTPMTRVTLVTQLNCVFLTIGMPCGTGIACLTLLTCWINVTQRTLVTNMIHKYVAFGLGKPPVETAQCPLYIITLQQQAYIMVTPLKSFLRI